MVLIISTVTKSPPTAEASCSTWYVEAMTVPNDSAEVSSTSKSSVPMQPARLARIIIRAAKMARLDWLLMVVRHSINYLIETNN